MKIDKEVEKFSAVHDKVCGPEPDIYEKVNWSFRLVVYKLFYWPVWDAIMGSVRWPIDVDINYED